ncbi:secreted protein [Venturia nashicola]|nr:secreted protein [Venturia nashicola]
MLPFTVLAAILVSNTSTPIVPPLLPSADQRAISFQPVLDYDNDNCFFTAAIDKDNQTNFGLENPKDFKMCRQMDRIDFSNAYVRSLCNNRWCAYMYAYYAEKSGKRGHQHDWQHAIAWTRNHTYLYDQALPPQEELHSISWSNHGKYTTKPISDDHVRLYNKTHVKLVYHKVNRGNRIELRLAKRKDDKIENPKGMWLSAPLVNITSDAPKLFETNFGYVAMDFKDPFFARVLNKAMPDEAKGEFDPGNK